MLGPSLQALDAAAAADLVSRRDRGDLSIYCYRPRCVFEKLWDDVTRHARGLVLDRRSGRVIARPFRKFFNLGEMPETQPEALPATPFRVEEKLDGSLGIVFHHEGRWDVCTKGAFESEQARYARAELLPRYRMSEVPEHWTVLTEMLYPENRIIVDYSERRELVLLAAVDRDTGQEVDVDSRRGLAEAMGMRCVSVFAHDDLLELPFGENDEGYVVRFGDGQRVKIKSPRYTQIHRVLEHCTPRRVLEMLQTGEYESIRAQIPHDLAGDFDDLGASLRMTLRQVRTRAETAFAALAPLGADRKSFALAAQRDVAPELRPLVFALLDGRDIEPLVFKLVRSRLGDAPEL